MTDLRRTTFVIGASNVAAINAAVAEATGNPADIYTFTVPVVRGGRTVGFVCSWDCEATGVDMAEVVAAIGRFDPSVSVTNGKRTVIPVSSEADLRKASSVPGAELVVSGTVVVDVTNGPVYLGDDTTVTGTAGAVIDAHPKTPGPGWTLFECVAQSGTVTISNLTIHGPSIVGSPDTDTRNSNVFRWIGSGDLLIDNVTITGLPGRAVQFSGVGNCTITDSTLNGYVSPVARWDSTGAPSPGILTISGCTITGIGSGPTSVGVYVHPHIPTVVRDSTFDSFARYGVYQNGSPPAEAGALIEDCEFRRCSVIQSGARSTATIRRIVWADWTPTPGSILRGNAVIEDSVFTSSPWASLAGDGRSITFRRCQWLPGATYCNFSTGTNLAVTFEDCTWANVPAVLIMNDTATGTVTFTRCTINDAGTSGDGIRILGAVTLDRRGLTLHSSRPFWNLGPSVAVID